MPNMRPLALTMRDPLGRLVCIPAIGLGAGQVPAEPLEN
jgi:hypothetical protein